MSEMLEKVARAILAKLPFGYGMSEAEAADYARAALEVIREPTGGAVLAGMAAEAPGAGSMQSILEYDNRGADSLAASFTAIIDAIANEEADAARANQ